MSQNPCQPPRHLLVLQDQEGQRTIPLEAATYSLGRDPSNSIVLHSKLVSRQHALLLRVMVPETGGYLFRVVDGNLQGKRSKNGLFVNDQRCFSHDLGHGDVVRFGQKATAQATYLWGRVSHGGNGFSNPSAGDSILNETYFAEDYPTPPSEISSEAALVRLASFPELSPHPIIEVGLSGTVTYLNPAAVVIFPDLQTRALNHPLLTDLIPIVQARGAKYFNREVVLDNKVFEQTVHFISESDLIRVYLLDITKRKQTEIALFHAEQKYRSIFENAAEGIYQITPDGRFTTANPMLARLLGYESPEELMESITNSEQIYVDPARWVEIMAQLREQGTVAGFELQAHRKNGSTIWLSGNARALWTSEGRFLGYEGSMQDITAQKHAESELYKRDRLLQGVAEATNTLLTELDFDIAIQRILKTLGLATGTDRVYLCENHPHPVSGEMALCLRSVWSRDESCIPLDTSVWQYQLYSTCGIERWYTTLASGHSIDGFTSNFPAEEQDLLVRGGVESVLLLPILLGQELWGYVGFDICRETDRLWSHNEKTILLAMTASISGALQRQQAERMVHYRAQHDLLTGLPNRVLFNERLSLALTNAMRNGEKVAVMFLDLDRFKTINDSLGHTVGDHLLKAVSQRLTATLREGDTVARWGGDEFTILLPQASRLTDVAQAAERILSAFNRVFDLEGHELYVGASIGIALFNDDGYDVETLIKNADVALYQAKHQGGNNYKFYNVTMSVTSPDSLLMEKSLHQALDREEFRLYYQPQLDINTGRIVGMESLIRWQHEELGWVSPKRFIPLAEENGLIFPIGEWTLRAACTQNKAWQDAGLPTIRIAVNLSARQFQQTALLESIERILEDTNLDPQFLELEITETTAIRDLSFTKSVLQRLQQMGVHLAIDDFGTGYSSLSHLQQLPLHSLKIDQSFVCNLTTNDRDSHIVSAIASLGRGLGLNVIAEGVETEAQLEFLRSTPCQEVQGYYFYKPLPWDEATELLRQQCEVKIPALMT